MSLGEPALVEFVRETIRREGPMPFRWFMEQALYHPEHGYYSSGRCMLGRRGDYFTNVSVGPVFGRLLAAQFSEIWERMGRPQDFAIVEQGTHHGDFARDVLHAISEEDAEFFEGIRYRIVEPFPILQARQREVLDPFIAKISWHRSLADLEPFCGVHFSNELLDAMPVHLLKGRDQGWVERCVSETPDGFDFVDSPLLNQSLKQKLEKLPPPPNETYETEINLEALNWIEAVSQKLTRGFVLICDYGHARADYYATERASGTLRCLKQHHTVPSSLVEIGYADITAHVDWTSLVERGEECGLRFTGFADQHHFLTGLVSEFITASSDRRGLQTILHPGLLGQVFQFLALEKNVESRVSLSGFKFGRDRRDLN